jgi:hypothetical protein
VCIRGGVDDAADLSGILDVAGVQPDFCGPGLDCLQGAVDVKVAVVVLVMPWTVTGASPPMVTGPTVTGWVLRRSISGSLMDALYRPAIPNSSRRLQS